MSYDHVKDFLNKTPALNHWLDHSKIVRFHKMLCTQKAKRWILCGGTVLGAIMALYAVHQVPQVITAQQFNATAARICSMGLFPVMIFTLVPCFNLLLLNPAWSKRVNLYHEGYLNLTQQASLKSKNKVVSNFLKNSGPHWDELAPLMLDAVNNENLPLDWWDALNTHLNRAPPQAKEDIVMVEEKNLNDLQNDLKFKVSSMNANQNNLSV